MQRIVDRALSKQVVERYQTAAEMLADLTAVKREIEPGKLNKKKFAISGERSVSEIRALVAEYASFRRRCRFLISAVATALFVFGRWLNLLVGIERAKGSVRHAGQEALRADD